MITMNNEVLMGGWSQERVRGLFWVEFMYTPRWLTPNEWQDAIEIWDTMVHGKGSGYACVQAVAQFLDINLEELPNSKKGW